MESDPPTRSDTVAGYVVGHDADWIRLRTLAGEEVMLNLTDASAIRMLSNLGSEPTDVGRRLDADLLLGRMVFAHGPVYHESGRSRYHPVEITVVGGSADRPVFEKDSWWVTQLRELAALYRRAQFGDGPADFVQYRTNVDLHGRKVSDGLQETDTLSRLVYGMATTYLLTGEEAFLDVAERGAEYQQRHLRVPSTDEPDGDYVYWHHALDVSTTPRRHLQASAFDDDRGAIPAYEQIYALVGLVQTYRITGDRALRRDIEHTVRLFERFFADRRRGGFFSHIDPVRLDPHAEDLGQNQSRKNWNSIGDHAPAYLFNLYLATGEPRYLALLEHTFDMIVEHFPDPAGLPFVRERFYADWTPDVAWGWQQDRAVVGHNLKIVWNLTRMHALRPKLEYRGLAAKLAGELPDVGRDPDRGGWYDVVRRQPVNGRHQFVWHDRKAWWQQEQAILAYLVLSGHVGPVGEDRTPYLRHAREAAGFYNAFFLDHEDGGVYFSVQADGTPYLRGTERWKGSHSMSFYHAAELCYLATVYYTLLIHGEPMDLWFKPYSDAAFPDRLLRVAPDVLPRGRVRLAAVEVDGESYSDFDPTTLVVRLPRSRRRLTVRVTLSPTLAAADGHR